MALASFEKGMGAWLVAGLVTRGVAGLRSPQADQNRRSAVGWAKRGARMAWGLVVVWGLCAAQSLQVRVLSKDRLPLSGALVRLLDSRGQLVARALTDDRGLASLTGVEGTVSIKVARIGYLEFDGGRIVLAPGESRAVTFRLPVAPATLPTLAVTGDARCASGSEAGPAQSVLWPQVQTALVATALGLASDVPFRRTQVRRELDVAGRVRSERRIEPRLGRGRPFVAAAWTELRAGGFRRGSGDSTLYLLPDPDVFTIDAFIQEYCLGAGRRADSAPGHVGLTFRPVEVSGARADIAGVMWVRTDSLVLTAMEVEFLEPGRPAAAGRVRGWMSFGRLKNGLWYIAHWGLRFPQVARIRTTWRDARADAPVSRDTIIGYVEHLGAAVPFTDGLPEARRTIVGYVHDSLSGAPLQGATVSGDAITEVAVTDDSGYFSIPSPVGTAGRLVVDHPLLRAVSGGWPTTVHLPRDAPTFVRVATPSAETLARALCGAEMGSSGLVGILPHGAGQDSLRARWVAISSELASVHTETTVPDSAGRWAFCDLPATGVVVDRVAGSGRPASVALSMSRGFQWVGAHVWANVGPVIAEVTGTVTDQEGRPVEGAEVFVPGTGHSARAGADGRFRLLNLPKEALAVAVRRVGYAPTTVPVVVGSGDLRVQLRRIAVLPTVTAEARRATPIPGFDERRRTTSGRLFDREELNAQPALLTLPDLLRRIPGLQIVTRGPASAAATTRLVSMGRRTVPPPWPEACYVQIFLDGVRVWAPAQSGAPYDLGQHGLGTLEAVEVYTGADTPVEFGMTGSVCGTVVLWTRR